MAWSARRPGRRCALSPPATPSARRVGPVQARRCALLLLAVGACAGGPPPGFTDWQPVATCRPVPGAAVDPLGRDGIEALACVPPGGGATVHLLSDDTVTWPVVGDVSLETPLADTIWLDGFMPLRLTRDGHVRWRLAADGVATGFVYTVGTRDAVSLQREDAAVALRLAPVPPCVTAVAVLFAEAEASLRDGAACLAGRTD